jgi:hypothetical protein
MNAQRWILGSGGLGFELVWPQNKYRVTWSSFMTPRETKNSATVQDNLIIIAQDLGYGSERQNLL